MTALRVHAARRAGAFAVILASFPGQAQAHLIETGLGPVYDGIAHFALTPEQLIRVLAIALLAGLGGKDRARRVVAAMPASRFVGGIAHGCTTLTVPAWLSLLAVGGLVAADPPLTTAVITAIAVLLGGLLGYANGAEMAHAGAGLRGVTGSAVAILVITKSRNRRYEIGNRTTKAMPDSLGLSSISVSKAWTPYRRPSPSRSSAASPPRQLRTPKRSHERGENQRSTQAKRFDCLARQPSLSCSPTMKSCLLRPSVDGWRRTI
jgi:urease accessory protein